MKIPLGPFFAVFAVFACLPAGTAVNAFSMGRKPQASPGETKPVMEWSGPNSGVSGPKAVLIADAEAWKKLWREAFGREAPEADFNGRFAVAVFAGSRPTGGWSVELRRSADAVLWRIVRPPPGAFVTQAFTAPYRIELLEGDASKTRLEQAK